MEKYQSIDKAIELAKAYLETYQGSKFPDSESANSLADFIETLAARLENIGKTQK